MGKGIIGLTLAVALTSAGGALAQIGAPITFSGIPTANGVPISDFLGLAMSNTIPNFGLFNGRSSALIGIDTQTGGMLAVLRTGDPLPASTGLIGTYNDFSNPSVNRATQTPTSAIAFQASLNSPTEDDGLFLLTAATTTLISPGSAGQLDRRSVPDLNDFGEVTWSDTGAVYRFSNGTVTPLVTTGSPMPGTGTNTFGRIGLFPTISNSGGVALVADGLGSAPDGIYYISPSGLVVTIAQVGDSVPGTAGGATFGGFDDRRDKVSINDNDVVAFTAQLNGTLNAGVFIWEPAGQNIVTVATDGMTPAGAPGPITDIESEYVGIDNCGDVGFEARYAGADRRIARAVINNPCNPIQPWTWGLNSFSPNFGGGPRDFTPRLSSTTFTIWRIGSGILQQPAGPAAVVNILINALPTPLGPGTWIRQGTSVNDAGVIVAAATQDQLYLLNGVLGMFPVIGPGAPSPRGIGQVVTLVDRQVMRGNSILFSVLDGLGFVLSHADAGAGTVNLGTIASGAGAPAAIGGTLDMSGPFDVVGNQLFYLSPVTGGSVTEAVFTSPVGGNATLLVGPGSPGPVGLYPPGTTFTSFDVFGPLVASGNNVVYRATLSTGEDGFYLSDTTGFSTKVVAIGDPAPGTTSTFQELFPRIAIDPGSRVLFSAELADTSRGVWEWVNGTLSPVALDNQVVGGSGTGGGPGGPLTLIFDGWESHTVAYSSTGTPLLAVQILAGSTAYDGLFKRNAAGTLELVFLNTATSPFGIGSFVGVENQSELSADAVNSLSAYTLTGAGAERVLMSLPY